MGRPIKKIFIGERGPGAGGSGIADVELVAGGTGYTAGALIISAPDLPGGVQATGTYTVSTGTIDSVTITDAGSGYTSEPTIEGDVGGTGAVLKAVFETEDGQPVIAATAFLEGGSNLSADILAQKGATIYKVTTADGTGECNLVDSNGAAHGTPAAAGEMQIIATDSGGATYSVTKLYNGHVRLENIGGSPEFADGVKVKWAKDGTPVLNESVSITG